MPPRGADGEIVRELMELAEAFGGHEVSVERGSGSSVGQASFGMPVGGLQ
jgi:hypothetical protein